MSPAKNEQQCFGCAQFEFEIACTHEDPETTDWEALDRGHL